MLVNNRRLLVIAHDVVAVAIAWIIAFIARYNFTLDLVNWEVCLQLLPVVLIVQGGLFWWSGLYRGLWRFASLPDLWNIVRASVMGVLAISLAIFIYNRLDQIPRTSLLLYPLFLILLLGGPRFIVRMWKDHRFRASMVNVGKNILIIGAGRAGEMLARDIMRAGEYNLVGFLDDKRKLQGLKLHDVPVLGQVNELGYYAEHLSVDVVVIAIPSATSKNMRKIVEVCENSGVEFRTLPPFHKMMSGEIGIKELREVSIEDLLGREQVTLDWSSIAGGLRDKTILVTGGGGSIGSELCRQISRLSPRKLIIFDHSEFNLYKIEQELSKLYPLLKMEIVLGNVTDKIAVSRIFESKYPDVVFHAAAYKHVPMLQNLVREAVYNNVIGTVNVARAASQHNCNSFVLISTDKAVNPTNVMGATKRIAEIYCQNLNDHSETNYITVRFGNVLDSAGSVVPLFRKQIKNGGPVTVTHKDITRYFMTIPEASQLILQAGTMGSGGEIFVLDMGEPVKIYYLAEQMILLSGKIPDEDIEIVFSGLRPGEKLYEELFHEKESLANTKHEKIFLANSRKVDWAKLNKIVDDISIACDNYDLQAIQKYLLRLVPEYTDFSEQNEGNVIEFRKGDEQHAS